MMWDTAWRDFLLMSFSCYFLGCSLVEWKIAFQCAATAAVLGMVYWEIFRFLGSEGGGIAIAVHRFGFFTALFMLGSALRDREKNQFRYLTMCSYCWFFLYWYCNDLSNPSTDAWVRFFHPVSFVGSFAVLLGFVAATLCGGGLPQDVMMQLKTGKTDDKVAFSGFIGHVHATPVWLHIIDACASAENFRRIYGSGYWFILWGVGGYFAFGQVWECYNPDTCDVYCAPKQAWYAIAHRVARALHLGTPEELKNRKATMFGLGEDFAFSWCVKAPGIGGAAVACLIFQRCLLFTG